MDDMLFGELMESVKQAVECMIATADKTGEAQTLSVTSDGWKPIVRNGKVVGRSRFAAAEITITPAKKRKANKRKAQKDANE